MPSPQQMTHGALQSQLLENFYRCSTQIRKMFDNSNKTKVNFNIFHFHSTSPENVLMFIPSLCVHAHIHPSYSNLHSFIPVHSIPSYLCIFLFLFIYPYIHHSYLFCYFIHAFIHPSSMYLLFRLIFPSKHSSLPTSIFFILLSTQFPSIHPFQYFHPLLHIYALIYPFTQL